MSINWGNDLTDSDGSLSTNKNVLARYSAMLETYRGEVIKTAQNLPLILGCAGGATVGLPVQV